MNQQQLEQQHQTRPLSPSKNKSLTPTLRPSLSVPDMKSAFSLHGE
jgi:hypothetical protein